MRKNFAIDIVFLATILLCVIAIFASKGTAQTAEAIYESTTEPTTEVITEPTQEHNETQPPVTEPPVTLYNVPLDVELQLHIIREAEEHNIDPAIIFAMAFRESTYRADTVGDGGDSYGLLQVQPYWHYGRMQKLGCTDLLDPFQNVTVAVDYLAEQLERYGTIEKALVGYNAGHYSGTITGYALDVLEKAEELRGETYALYR